MHWRPARLTAAQARSAYRRSAPVKRARGNRDELLPFSPPEDWHEPSESTDSKDPYDFRIIVQPPGRGYAHVVTPEEIRQRLCQLPAHFVAPLEVVQLSQMTRKKESFACYGMQWGTALYLYPIESGRVEYNNRPPKPSQLQEARMFGGRWEQASSREWKLVWTEATLKDFYLNNILIHELGHLLDERNSTYTDRERFAEWFALEHGYKPTRAQKRRSASVRRRHGR